MSLSVHEAAHAWTADRLGDPTARLLGRLTLNPLKHIDMIGTVVFPLLAVYSGLPLIGWAKPVPVSMQNLRSPRRDFAVVALAGPVSNLALATLGAARVMSRDKVSGSIRAGKQADLILVDGDPTKNIGDIRNTDVVISRGRIYDPAALLRAAGTKPR